MLLTDGVLDAQKGLGNIGQWQLDGARNIKGPGLLFAGAGISMDSRGDRDIYNSFLLCLD